MNLFGISKKIPQKQRNKNTSSQKKYLFGTQEYREKSFKKRRKPIFFPKIKAIIAYISRQEQKRFIILWILILSIALWLFVTFWPVFRVKEIFITRQGTIININQAYTSVDPFRWKNIFFLQNNQIAQRLQNSQNTLKNININTKFPDTLDIVLQSYTPIFQTEQYIILENGAIIPRENYDTTSLPWIRVAKDIGETYIFWELLHPQDLKYISQLLNKLPKNIAGFEIKNTIYFPTEREIFIVWKNDTLFIFDLQADIGQQIQQLSIFNREKHNITQTPYVYIDIRIREKIFLCGLEAEYQCRKNIKYIYGDDIFTLTQEPINTILPEVQETIPWDVSQESSLLPTDDVSETLLISEEATWISPEER